MNPEPGQYIKILFNNGTNAEGIVESWSDDKSVLSSKNNKSIMVIQKTKIDVLAVLIYKSEITSQLDSKSKEEIMNKYSELINEKKKDLNTVKELAELKQELNVQEREDFFSKLKTHQMTNVGSIGKYALPNFSKKPGALEHPAPEDKRKNLGHCQDLFDMFASKDENNR